MTTSEITHADIAALARWMADSGHTPDDIAYAIEKPWKHVPVIKALRAGNEPDEGDET